MKFKLLVMALAPSVSLWAQDSPSTSTPNATPKPVAKGCCHHSADAKDGMACHHTTGDAKDAAGCCGEMKNGKSCCAGMAKNAKACNGKDMKKCMKECKKNGGCAEGKCCGAGSEKSAMNCCGSKCTGHQQAASIT